MTIFSSFYMNKKLRLLKLQRYQLDMEKCLNVLCILFSALHTVEIIYCDQFSNKKWQTKTSFIASITKRFY